MASGLDSIENKNEAPIKSTLADPTGAEGTPAERVDKAAMDMATRAQHRIHEDETRNPGQSIFTK
jgi:hypothetical protein